MNSQSADDMFGRVFPGEKWTITFEATDEQADAMTAHVDAHTDDADERLMFLQMLGLADYVSAFNPNARDAWTRKPAQATASLCARGHRRDEYGYEAPDGRKRCRQCSREYIAATKSRKAA